MPRMKFFATEKGFAATLNDFGAARSNLMTKAEVNRLVSDFEVLKELREWGPFDLIELEDHFDRPIKGALIEDDLSILRGSLRRLFEAGFITSTRENK